MIPKFRLALPVVPALLLTAVLGLAACGNSRPVGNDEYFTPNGLNSGGGQGRLFEDSSISLLGGKDKNKQDQTGGLGVNAFLWRGALDTLAFMPLASADPFGGVIITDWYQPPAGSGERFKATAYIIGRQLRADALKISIFRQVQQGAQWVDAPVATGTATEIENKVLARARELRTQSVGS